MQFSLYAVRRSSLLCFGHSFILDVIRENPQAVSVLTESAQAKSDEIQYSRISVIPMNHITDYDYFISVLHASIHTIFPTNLVKTQHLLENVGSHSDDEK